MTDHPLGWSDRDLAEEREMWEYQRDHPDSLICLCGAHIPCRHEKEWDHFFGSYFSLGGPVAHLTYQIDDEHERRAAELLLTKPEAAEHPSLALRLQQAITTYLQGEQHGQPDQSQ